MRLCRHHAAVPSSCGGAGSAAGVTATARIAAGGRPWRRGRAACPEGAPADVILDNLSAHKGADIRRWAKKSKIELCFTPTYAS